MNLSGHRTKLFLLTLALLVVQLYAAPFKGTRDEAHLSNDWALQNYESALEEPLEEDGPPPPPRMLRRSALDNDIFANGLRWRRKRTHY